jgi:hypothetical protein
MSKASEAKKARRRKRRAARDERWIPEPVMDELAATDAVNLAAVLELFDERITERGWTFDDEQSDEDFAIWFYPPSGSAVDDASPVTTIWMDAADEGELVHLMFVGATEEFTFTPDEFFERLDVIEPYRLGDPIPEFG